MFDVAIIGAGVTGSAVARELSKYDVKVCILESENDVATGASRANSAIVHAGYDCVPDTMMAKLNVLGAKKMKQLCFELDVPYKNIGSLVLAFNEDEKKVLEELLIRAERNNVPDVRILNQRDSHIVEPNINKDIIASLYAKNASITSPYELNIALAENAVINGVEIILDFKVDKITKTDESFKLCAKDRCIDAKYVVNAAGLYADEISKLCNAGDFTIVPRKGEYMMMDRQESKKLHTVLFQAPSKMGKGVLVAPTVEETIFAGPTALDMADKEDTSTTLEGLEYLKKMSVKSVPSLNLGNVITQFAGIRAVLKEKHDFLIEESKQVKGFVQAAGICSPGLSASPAMGQEVVGILKDAGLELKINDNFNPIRRKYKSFREMTDSERSKAIIENPLNGKIICRCETVTEAEVVAAIHAPVPAVTIDAIKRRTRAGMGRCQGGFCMPRVMEIISRETGMNMGEILKASYGSNIILPNRKGVE
ncbi:MAG: FAD-dependent oxidoreductase [Clostridiales bacterium]|nr:FAD-dependent oxidoreductase [Clostridiales bacterium]